MFTSNIRKFLIVCRSINSSLFTSNSIIINSTHNYYVYNVSRVTGKKLSKAEMLKLLGMKDSAFKSKVTSGVKKWWNDNILKTDKTAATKKLYNKAIASKSINSAVLYVNSKGKKCFLLRQMKAPTQFTYNDIYATI